MSLPSQDVLDDIKELISAVTGFEESDENFAICERYCLSHVVHHTYPFVNRTAVKNLIDSYVTRFYGHGYFKVSQEFNSQVNAFLSNGSLFEKNPQYDIQWCLLSLMSSLSSNLTAVKDVPELLPTDIKETEVDETNWHEYLNKDLPTIIPIIESEIDEVSTEEEDNIDDEKENHVNSELQVSKMCQIKEKTELSEANKIAKKNERESNLRKLKIQQFIDCRKATGDIEIDFKMRGNISEKFDRLLSNEGFHKESQFLSELKLMEYILYQFQTGERILQKKGLVRPALVSLTQKTLSNYLESLQPYFKIIRCFNDFNEEIMKAKYPHIYQEDFAHESKSSQSFSFRKENISSVLYIYCVMLRKALDPFQDKIMDIVDNLESQSLIRMQQKIQSHFFPLTSIFYVHGLATKNWKTDSNWMCSIRILSVLHNAIMNATTAKMSLLFLNIFLHCFQVYLDIIDSWISSLDLNDPNDEFIVAKSKNAEKFGIRFEVRQYEGEMKDSGIKEVPILNFIAEKMIHVGQSLEVLRRMGRFVTEETNPKTVSHQKLVEGINSKISSLEKLTSSLPKPKIALQEKKKSIFTMRNVNLIRRQRDLGGGGGGGEGDGFRIEDLLQEEEREEKKKEEVVAEESNGHRQHSSDMCWQFVRSTVNNPFFEMAFDSVGVERELKRLKEVKEKSRKAEEGQFCIVKVASDRKSAGYPYHKIISETCQQILAGRFFLPCELVKDIVVNECRLKRHLSLLRSLLLFSDSYLIQPFIFGFFTQSVVWENSYSLTVYLKECLEVRYQDLASSLFVSSVKEFDSARKTVLEAIDGLAINFRFDWPLTVIFTEEAITKYNQVFRLALKLKWAHWTLSNLQFQNEAKGESGSLFKSTNHRLRLFRFWFLSLLNRIINYFVSQMNPPDPNFDSCNDLNEIIQVHFDFIGGIHYHCLLSDKSPEMRNLIFETLIPLCLDLEKVWSGEKIVPNSKLTSMEKIFADCQLRLSRLMSSLEGK